jgi:porphobilinogen deaminase
MTLDEIVREWTAGDITSAEALYIIEREGLFAEALMVALTHTRPSPPAESQDQPQPDRN